MDLDAGAPEPVRASEAHHAAVTLGARFEAALLYATQVHGGQRRKGTTVPYVAHLLGVGSLVLEDGGDEDEAIGALLHDAAEDQGGQDRLDDIAARFGPTVARIVDGCSDTLDSPKPPWRARKAAYVARLEGEPSAVLRVSLADKLFNVRSIVRDVEHGGASVWARFSAPPAELARYHRSLDAVFSRRCPGPMARQYAEVVARLEELAERP
ncbi:MAG: HD domain-containing protein [Candidatus Limnocylindrales bacterium]